MAGWPAEGLVVAGGVDDEFADELAGGGVDDPDVQVLDEHQDGVRAFSEPAPMWWSFPLTRRVSLPAVVCQNSHIGAELAFRAGQAALRCWLVRPPKTCLRSIRAVMSTTLAGLCWGGLLQALVRTVAVMVPGVLGQDAAEVLLAEDQHVV